MDREHEHLITAIVNAVSRLDKVHSDGIAVSQPPVFAERESLFRIYEEGKMFGGIESVGQAEAWLAPIAAAHISSTVPVQKYLSEASRVFGVNACLSLKYDAVENFSPQVVLWWKRKNSQESYDFIKLDLLSETDRRSFLIAIERKSRQAIKFISGISDKPTIWGTWGYGTKEEREKEGLTRGGPTLKEGHIHFACFKSSKQHLIFSKLPAKERLNHYAPWNKIILERIGTSFKIMLAEIFRSQFSEHASFEVTTENHLKYHENGAISIYDGLKLDFNEISFDNVLLFLTRIAGEFEDFYGKLHEIYSHYHKRLKKESKKEVEDRIFDFIKKYGIPKDQAQGIAELMLSVQPTLGQLLLWRDDLSGHAESLDAKEKTDRRIRKYVRTCDKLKNYKGSDKVINAILRDQTSLPIENGITLTWPVHASFCYVISDYDFNNNGKIIVHSVRLYPELVTTESGTEKELGVVLKRPI